MHHLRIQKYRRIDYRSVRETLFCLSALYIVGEEKLLPKAPNEVLNNARVRDVYLGKIFSLKNLTAARSILFIF